MLGALQPHAVGSEGGGDGRLPEGPWGQALKGGCQAIDAPGLQVCCPRSHRRINGRERRRRHHGGMGSAPTVRAWQERRVGTLGPILSLAISPRVSSAIVRVHPIQAVLANVEIGHVVQAPLSCCGPHPTPEQLLQEWWETAKEGLKTQLIELFSLPERPSGRVVLGEISRPMLSLPTNTVSFKFRDVFIRGPRNQQPRYARGLLGGVASQEPTCPRHSRYPLTRVQITVEPPVKLYCKLPTTIAVSWLCVNHYCRSRASRKRPMGVGPFDGDKSHADERLCRSGALPSRE